MKIKNKNFKKYKNKKIFFFRPKLGQEIKNPEKSGKIRKSKKIQKILPKILTKKSIIFLIDFHSLTPAAVPFPLEQSLILLNKSRSQALCSKCLSAHPRG